MVEGNSPPAVAVWWALALGVTLAGCNSNGSLPPTVSAPEEVPTSVDNGVTTAISVGALAALEGPLHQGILQAIGDGYPVGVETGQALVPGVGVVSFQSAETSLAIIESAQLGVDTVDGVILLDSELEDISLDLIIAVDAVQVCELDWVLVEPRLRVPMGGNRDKPGNISLFVSGEATVTWGDVLIEVVNCDGLLEDRPAGGRLQPSDLGPAGPVVASAALLQITGQLAGGLASALVSPVETALSVNPATRWVFARADGELAPIEASLQLASSVDDNTEPALLVGEAGVRTPLDVAAESERHPCVPPEPAPAPLVASPAGVAALLGDSTGPAWAMAVDLWSIQNSITHLYRGGQLCTSITAEELTAGGLSEVLEPLGAFSEGLPLRAVLRPAGRPTAELSPDDEPPRFRVELPAAELADEPTRTAIDLYMLIDGAEVRLYTVRARFSLVVSVIASDLGLIQLVVDEVEVTDVDWESPVFPQPTAGTTAAQTLGQAVFSAFAASRTWVAPGLPAGVEWVADPPEVAEEKQLIFRWRAD